MSLVVSEVFGPTFQGEGPSLGRRAGFVRLGRCDLECAWCDTPYTWDWARYDPAAELTSRGVDDVLTDIVAMDVPMLVVTGGEPLLQQRGLVELVGGAKARGMRVEVETNGMHEPVPALVDLVDQWNVSPKLANSGMPEARRLRPLVLSAFDATGNAVFKFVATSPADLDEIASLVDAAGLHNIWVMPEGVDAATLMARAEELAEAVAARGWNLTTRLHILIWGDRRGV